MLDLVIILKEFELLPLSLAIEDKDARGAHHVEFFRPKLLALVEDDIREGRVFLLEEAQQLLLHGLVAELIETD